MGESFGERLKRLRREGGTPSAGRSQEPPDERPVMGPATPPEDGLEDQPEDPARGPSGRGGGAPGTERRARRTAGMPPWLARSLERRRAAANSRAGQGARDAEAPAPGPLAPRSKEPPEGLEVSRNGHGEFAARITSFEAAARHGDWTLDEVDHVESGTLALLAGDPSLAAVDLRDCVYLDTETTGLGGGAGVFVYMIGLGVFDGDRFELWQGFLRSPAEERALLTEAARRIEAAGALVSFFGKSFDRHRLDDKMAIHGVPSPFAARPHLDLYHPFQRLTRKRLPDGRLATMEAELCGLKREDDLPGAFAPEAWFDFLGGRAHRLEGVFRHNRDDVLSLVTLASYLGRARAECRRDGRALEGPAGARARGLARSYLERGERELALPWLDRALERERGAQGAQGARGARGAPGVQGDGGHAGEVRELLFARGEVLRRLGEHSTALEAFEQLGTRVEDVWAVRAALESAKVLEHRIKDFERARAACERGLRVARRALCGAERRRLEADLVRRQARLTSKGG